MSTSPLRTALAASAIFAISASSLAACSNDATVTEGGNAVTDTATPTSLLDLSEDAAKRRETPLPTDLGLLIPSPEVLQEESAAFGGLYKAVKDQIIPMDSPLIPWAEGLTLGHERVFEFQSANEADPMQTHTANSVFRALVFNTPEDAKQAMIRYVFEKGPRPTGGAVTQEDYMPDDTKWAALYYRVSGQSLSKISEGLLQRGSVIVWVVVQDNVSMSWETLAIAAGKLYLDAILTQYPSLAG
jgi:hypothetical protein